MINNIDRELTFTLFQLAAETMGVSLQDLCSPCRRQELVMGRTLVFDRLRALDYSWNEIGQLTCRDHSTVIHCTKELRQWLDIYPRLTYLYSQFQLLADQKSMAKYHNHTFTNEYGKWDSTLEFDRYLFLLDAQKKGLISGLQRQVCYELIPRQTETTVTSKQTRKGIVKKTHTRVVERNLEYTADFVYVKADGQTVVEDTKGYRTKDYIIRRKIMRWQGNPIREVVSAGEPV